MSPYNPHTGGLRLGLLPTDRQRGGDHSTRRSCSHRVGLGTPAFIYLCPRLTVSGYERAIVKHGLGAGRVPINTLFAVPGTSSPSASRGSLMATGADDLLHRRLARLSKGPQALPVPDMAGRYFSMQFTDPSNSANFAYVGKRTTGTKAGDYVLSSPGWKGTVPNGMTRISSPTDPAVVIGRDFVESDSDLPIAYAPRSKCSSHR